MLRSLASFTTRRPRLAATLVAACLVAAIGLGTTAGGDYVDDFSVPGIESQKAQDRIAAAFPGQGGDGATVVFSGDVRGDRVTAALAKIARQPHVAAVDDLVVSQDGRTAFARITYDDDADALGAEPRERLEHATKGLDVAMSGPVIDAGNEPETPVGELAGIGAALILLLLVLRSLRATWTALLTAAFGVAAGFTVLGLGATQLDLPSLAPTMAAMLGIGAGIDYALLNASRQQEELRGGASPRDAAITTNGTAGHAALTAAAIVLVSISGLLVTGIPFVGKVGVATGAMVLVTALVAVLLLPPLLAAGGRKMLPRRERATAATHPEPQPGFAVRRPWIALALGVVIAGAMAWPTIWLEIGQPDDGNQPTSTTQRQAYDRLASAFGPGVNGPLVAVADADNAPQLRRAFAQLPDVASVSAPTTSDDTALLTITPRSSPQDERTTQLVHDLRATADGKALIGGYTARLVDEADRISERLPVFALVVVGLSLLLLAVTFRSLKLAVLSAVFNLVSIAAAYGIVHLLFQKEGGADLIGVEVQPIIAYTPLFMFAILFGLSTDYNVFLLSRVREEWQRLGSVRPAVAVASARTKRTITAAGAIMIVVFLGFATDPDPTIRMTGVGLATAILVDITLVRLLLAPAALTLIGDRLWGQRAASTDSARSRSPASWVQGENTIATDAEKAR